MRHGYPECGLGIAMAIPSRAQVKVVLGLLQGVLASPKKSPHFHLTVCWFSIINVPPKAIPHVKIVDIYRYQVFKVGL